MKIVIKIGKWLFSLLLVLYIATCAYLYFQDLTGTILSGVLFKAVKPKGLVFYLHGNGGAITTCVNAAQTYTNINYDCFVLDYRGFGKSEGEIISQNQFYSDVEIAYDSLCKD